MLSLDCRTVGLVFLWILPLICREEPSGVFTLAFIMPLIFPFVIYVELLVETFVFFKFAKLFLVEIRPLGL